MPSINVSNFGGIAPKIRSRSLPSNMADIAENVDLSHGTLKPFTNPLQVNTLTDETVFVEDCCFEYGDCTTDITKHGISCNSIVVATSESTIPMYRKGSSCDEDWRPLGFPCDLPKPNVSSDPHNDNFRTENRSYVYTLVNDLGWESAPSFPSDEIIVDHENPVTVSGITSLLPPEYAIESINVYRLMRGLDRGEDIDADVMTGWYLVGTIPYGETSFIDITNVVGKELVTEKYESVPDDLREVRDWRQGRLAGLSENTLLMTERNLPYAWNRRYRKAFYDTPIALVIEGQTAFVMTDGTPSMVRMTGDCELGQCLESSEYPQSMPIISRRSAVGYNGYAIYASSEGLVILTPSGEQVITTDSLYGREEWGRLMPHTMRSVIHQGYYYGTTDVTTIRLKVVDPARDIEDSAKLTTLSITPNDWYVNEQDELYFVDDTGTYLWGEGDGFMEMHWKSKEFRSTQNIRFSAFKHSSDGSDNTLEHVVNSRIISNINVLRSKPYRLPMGYTGNFWQFDVKGTSEVYEHEIATSVSDLSE